MILTGSADLGILTCQNRQKPANSEQIRPKSGHSELIWPCLASSGLIWPHLASSLGSFGLIWLLAAQIWVWPPPWIPASLWTPGSLWIPGPLDSETLDPGIPGSQSHDPMSHSLEPEACMRIVVVLDVYICMTHLDARGIARACAYMIIYKSLLLFQHHMC